MLPGSLAERLAGADWQRELAGEAGADVFRLTLADATKALLKHGCGGVADDLVDEFARLRWLAGRMPCPKVLAFTSEADSAWLLTTALPGRSGDAWLEADPARLPMVIDAFAACLRTLHGLPTDDCPFEAGTELRLAAARRAVVAGSIDLDDLDDDHAGWDAQRLLAELCRLRPPAAKRVVTHGDFSLGNVLIDDDGAVTGMIDVGRLGLADPYQDVAIFWQNLAEWGEAAQARFLAGIGVTDVDRQRLDFHRCLDEFF